jgi:hypothetical protein
MNYLLRQPFCRCRCRLKVEKADTAFVCMLCHPACDGNLAYLRLLLAVRIVRLRVRRCATGFQRCDIEVIHLDSVLPQRECAPPHVGH